MLRDDVAISRALVGGVILLVVVFAVIGLYTVPGILSQSTTSLTSGFLSTSATMSTKSLASTQSTLAVSSSTSLTTATTTQSTILTAQPFSFFFTASPDVILLAPGMTQDYVTLGLVPFPSSLTSSSEVVSLNYSAVAGISLKFTSNPVKVAGDSRPSVPLRLTVSESTAPGDYNLPIRGTTGTLTENYTLAVKVVQYLVYMKDNSFLPSNLTVRSGSTVYWMSLDAPLGAYPVMHTVTFTTGTTSRSPPLQQFDWYSTTFTARGAYSYHCEFHPQAMNAMVTVLG